MEEQKALAMETPLSLLSLKGYVSIRRRANHPELSW